MKFCDFTDMLTEIGKESELNIKTNLIVMLLNPEGSREVVSSLLRAEFDTRIREVALKKLVDLSRSSPTPSTFTIHDIHSALVQLEKCGDAVTRKQILEPIFERLSRSESTHFKGLITNNLRIGVRAQTILKALSIVFRVSLETVNKAYKSEKDLNLVLAKPWLTKAPTTTLQLFRPVHLMLAKLADVKNINYQRSIVEPKYDGMRGQIHYKASTEEYRVYSRTRREEAIKLTFHSSVDLILDSEILYMDTNSGALLDFGHVQNRKTMETKSGTEAIAFVFDILFCGGESLVETPLHKRKEILSSLEIEGRSIRLVPTSTVSNAEELLQSLGTAKKDGLEGLMIKSLDDNYKCDKRAWLKLKRDIDTYDLCVIGAYFGEGSREGLYGSLLLAYCDKGKFVDVCKVGSGFVAEDLIAFKRDLVQVDTTYETKAPTPDIFFDGSMVIEVKASGVTVCKGHPSLRFPVYIRRRPDKTPEMTDKITVDSSK